MYETKDYSRLLGLPGFTDLLLTDHFTLYEGYVKNVNLIGELVKTVDPGSPQAAELRRRFGWEWNGMRLHELYFENISKDHMTPDPATPLVDLIEKSFGSVEAWDKDFRSAGTTRGIGWVLLTYDSSDGRLFNTWINEHDGGHLAGTTPLIVMDVFEHAYIRDYGVRRADYVAAFMNAIDWRSVADRLRR